MREQELEQSRSANRQFPGSISATEISRLQLVVDQSRLAIEQARHEQSIAEANANEKLAAARIAESRLSKYGVESAVAGYAVEIAVEPGEWVEPGKPIVRIISLDPVRIECFVDGRKHGRELVGRPMTFTLSETADSPTDDSSPRTRFPGTVTFVSPELHPVTGQARDCGRRSRIRTSRCVPACKAALVIEPTTRNPGSAKDHSSGTAETSGK